MRSGVESYLRFRTLLGLPAFPPRSEAVELWSGAFNSGRTFNRYMAHLRRPSILPNQPLSWLTPTARAIGKGLKNAQDLSSNVRNSARPIELFILIGRTGVSPELGQAFSVSYLSEMRVPSETIILVRAFRDGPITELRPQSEKALIGPRAYKADAVLLVKFPAR